jgi:hypothetical protein
VRPDSDLIPIIDALHFQEDRTDLIRRISAEKWSGTLAMADQAQLTLPLAVRRLTCLPPEIQLRVNTNLARNAERTKRTLALYQSVAQAMDRRGVKFLVLKGITHYPLFCDDLAHRPQFDLDFYCLPESIEAAADVISSLGYEPVPASRGPERDHMPAMIRKNGFRWQGDYYDPELPLIIEPHFRFWNQEREAFSVSGADCFWNRRTIRNIGGCDVPALDPLDDVAYTTWHLVKHLLRGNLRLYHVYELAHFLDRSVGSDAFWLRWRATRAGERTAEPIAFRLASEWFGCRIHPVVQEEIDRLPASVDRWFRLFAFSAVTGMQSPNKDELFLHLALVKDSRERFRIATQRLLPMNPPRVVLDAHVREDGLKLRARRLTHRLAFLMSRVVRHVRAFVPVIRSGFRWWRAA